MLAPKSDSALIHVSDVVLIHVSDAAQDSPC